MNLPLLFGGAFTVFCAALLVRAIVGLQRARRSVDWPPREGTIESSRLWGRRNVDGEMQEVERLSIDYVYRIDGRRHSASAIAFYTVLFPETVALAERFPAGARVDVYVDPRDPSRSVLVPGPNPARPVSDVLIAGVGLVVGVAVTTLGSLGALG